MSREGRLEFVFDEETYTKAKPLFTTVFTDLKDLDLREALAAVVRMVGERSGMDAVQNMKLYLVCFLTDVRDVTIILDEPGADGVGADSASEPH